MLIKSSIFNFLVLGLSVLYYNAQAALPEAQMKAFKKQIKNQCVAKTKIAPEQIDLMLSGTFPDEPKASCFLKCVFEKSLVTTKGHIDWKKISTTSKAMLPPKLAKKVEVLVNTCKDRVPLEDLCADARDVTICVYNADPDVFKFMTPD